METSEDVVLFERRGRVALLSLNRPDRRNAVNADLSRRLGDLMAQCAADEEVSAIVLTGAGPVFCAGADLKSVISGESIYDEEHRDRGFAGFVSHYVDKPVIAAVNGSALGGGTEIVLACDLAVMANDAKLGLPEVQRGLVASGGGVIRMPGQIPPKIAAELILTGAPIDAEAALRWGLVNAVVERSELVDTALELAQRIAANAPLAVRAAKRIMHRRKEFGSDWAPDLWAMNIAESSAVRASDDALEGARAFAEKRPPRWTGR